MNSVQEVHTMEYANDDDHVECVRVQEIHYKASIAGEGSELGTRVLAEIGKADDLDPGQLCLVPLVRRL
jgi:hypothetical protein